ncbi:MAG: hypothetical protein COV67_07275 [Nitrospinae bacterium CG11_big_fil_rev_8_21_14_0_20_56_8]|nr:MAG: hypothetical protein COV67_07275 [Nitrospinae bacterium CG11_big_fil_rev_8_21_14_0_20_56_8]
MENRLLLAFVLSLVVFVLWGWLVSTLQPPPPPKQAIIDKIPAAPGNKTPAPQAGTAETSPASGTPETSAAVPAGQTESETVPTGGTTPSAPPVIVNISTGRATIQVSNRGGVIQSVLLNRFKNDDGTPVDLVNHVQGTSLPLAIESNEAEITRILNNSYYTVSASSITLTPAAPEATLTLNLDTPGGLQVTRELTFHYDDFMIDVHTHIKNPGRAGENLQYFIVWGPDLGGKVNSKTDYIVFSGPTTFVNNDRIETAPEDIQDFVRLKGEVDWTAFQNKYFAAALLPESGTKGAIVKQEEDRNYVGLELETVQGAADVKLKLYAGTKELQILENAGHKLIRILDYGWLGNKFAFLVKPMLKFLQYFYEVFHNYGWAIIMLTVIIKVLFFPLTHKSFKSMKGMQKIQPYVKIIQERNKDDRQKMNEEMLELYRKHRVNPMGGCLPMVLQIPVFIALYHALFFSIELRGAPFILWITDLSVADPYYVTPIFMGLTMILQQRLTPSAMDPVQQKIMMLMPIVFTFLFLTFPSGLVIYWTVNNLLTIAQQYYIYKVAKD